MHGSRESDSSIVPRKPSNKGRAAARAAERVEGRGLAKGNAREQSRLRTLGRESLNQALARIRQATRQRPGAQLTALWHHVYSVDTLRDAFYGLNGLAGRGPASTGWQNGGYLMFISRIHIRRRACASDLRQEPGAVVPHAGICAGGAGQPASLPRPIDNAPMN